MTIWVLAVQRHARLTFSLWRLEPQYRAPVGSVVHTRLPDLLDPRLQHRRVALAELLPRSPT